MHHHHARVYIGTFEAALTALPESDRSPGADVRHIELQQLGITEARDLAREAVRRPVTGREDRIFVVGFSRATIEAQNALLKLLEEPPGASCFCLVVPREELLIPTVRSRLMRLEGERKEHAQSKHIAAAFLKGTYGERLSAISDHVKQKDVEWMENLLNGLELWAVSNKHEECMREVTLMRKYFGNRGASKKMLLEQLAITFPRA